jgi:hypothetical protein
VSNSPNAITNDVFSSHQVASVPAVADANSGKQFGKHTKSFCRSYGLKQTMLLK